MPIAVLTYILLEPEYMLLPGAPINIILCPPTAATSNARSLPQRGSIVGLTFEPGGRPRERVTGHLCRQAKAQSDACPNVPTDAQSFSCIIFDCAHSRVSHFNGRGCQYNQVGLYRGPCRLKWQNLLK